MTTDTLEHIEDITLTSDQQAALDAFRRFLLNPMESVFVLSGYSGCGKTTLVRYLLDSLPTFMKAARLINPSQEDYELALTATTNKAAENLSQISGHHAVTIHAFLGLRVHTDYKTGETNLVLGKNAKDIDRYLLFIDEASYVDPQLLRAIFTRVRNSKIVFIGDPAQLTPVKLTDAPVFNANFKGAELTEVVRQSAGNPIVDLSTKFRHTVNTGEWFGFKPDGQHIVYLADEGDFNAAIAQEFTRPDWKFKDSKILAWTNKRVIEYNNYVNQLTKGATQFQTGDYAVCNNFISNGRQSIKTDQLVQLTYIGPEELELDVLGHWIRIDHGAAYFFPNKREDKVARLKEARAKNDHTVIAKIMEQWIDLRAAYACTINKSQGSTFDKVFIDLNDVSRCNNGNQIARMLYVAVSRARHQVFLTGDLVS